MTHTSPPPAIKTRPPAGANPCRPNHPKASPNNFPVTGPISSLLTSDLIATYGCAARSTIFGDVVISFTFLCCTAVHYSTNNTSPSRTTTRRLPKKLPFRPNHQSPTTLHISPLPP